MKRTMISVIAGVSCAALFCLSGCTSVTPEPVKDPNAPALPASIRKYSSDILLFEEQRAPLMVSVVCSQSAEEVSAAGVLKDVLGQSEIQCSAPGKPFDVQITLRSEYKELTPAPKCRMNHLLSLSTAAADGKKILPDWSHKTEGFQVCASAADAKARMLGEIKESVKEWEKTVFTPSVGKSYQVTLLRFRLSKRLIELHIDRINSDLNVVRRNIKGIKGVYDLRMIELDTASGIATFRVLHRNGVILSREINKQK